ILLLAVFASVALALASVGIYSVLSYIVRGRRREIGIRSALGAQTADVVKLVVSEGMTPTLAGIGVGIAAAFASGRLIEKLVFGVSASDPLTLALVAATLMLVALLASVLPAYRASRLAPSSARSSGTARTWRRPWPDPTRGRGSRAETRRAPRRRCRRSRWSAASRAPLRPAPARPSRA